MSHSHFLAWTNPDGTKGFRDSLLTEDAASRTAAAMNLDYPRCNYVAVPQADMAGWLGESQPPAEEPRMLSRAGAMVPVRHVPDRFRLEDQTVRGLVEKANGLRRAIQDFKVAALDDVRAFMDILGSQYGGKKKVGTKGGVTLESFCGLMKVEVSSANNLEFGPEIQVARTLIGECIEKWSGGADSRLVAIVTDAFRVGQDGKVRVDTVVGLKRLKIEDDTWSAAMKAIDDAMRIRASREYLRVYTRETPDGKWVQVGLDASRV